MRDMINFQCWEGYESAGFLRPFEKKSGTRINSQTLLSDADTAQQLASGNREQCHVININNAWVRDYLHPRGLIRTLDEGRFGRSMEGLLDLFNDDLRQWAYDESGNQIGICQRFGPFNLVVNTRKIDIKHAEDQGFHLAADRIYNKRFGILSYIDFNLFHLCIASELNPFAPLNRSDIQKIERTAIAWQKNACLISDDHFVLNRALIAGEIDFYLSGGVYTAAVARRDGHQHIRAITPASGPIEGKGGIVFAEITSIMNHPQTSAASESFLEWLISPETSASAAMTERTCNPVVQMGNPDVLRRFNTTQLNWLQWDELAESVARSAPYALMPNHADVLTLWQQALHRYRQARR